jgi:hypothetical protein
MNAAFTGARWIAIAIALLGVIDPAVTTMRPVRPEVAVVAADPRDSSLARRIAGRLEDDYEVIPASFANAAATIIVGDAMPERAPVGLVFGVSDASRASIHRFDVPRLSTTEARIPVTVSGRAPRPARIEVEANGTVVDRVDLDRGDREAFHETLTIAPPIPGPLRLRARLIAGDDTVAADAITNVVDAPAPVLFFDRRPSWTSTFVRRALESDRRFAVASRISTSRGISTEAGQPPSSLADPTVLELYDVIVVGAPELLTASDAAGLETFLRRRGGIVVLLFDERPADSPATRLAGTTKWSMTTEQASIAVRSPADSVALRASELAWPDALPPEAIVRATSRTRPAVWSRMIGQGELIVSGALDSWKFRDEATSDFGEFWQATISRAARDAGRPIQITVAQDILEPGETVQARITLRDSLGVPAAILRGPEVANPVRLWPRGRGEYDARFRAPAVAGEYAIEVSSSGVKTVAPVVVADRVERALANDSAAITTLAEVSGGGVTTPDEISERVRRAVPSESRRERWWPMHSPWWIVAFAGLLGVEWIARRRRGLA